MKQTPDATLKLCADLERHAVRCEGEIRLVPPIYTRNQWVSKESARLLRLAASKLEPAHSAQSGDLDRRDAALQIARKLMVEYFGPGKSSATPADWVIDAMLAFATPSPLTQLEQAA